MAEDGLNARSASSHGCPQPCNRPLSLPPPGLWIWYIEESDRIRHMESQGFGPGVQNSSFSTVIPNDGIMCASGPGTLRGTARHCVFS
jgi:hypothetical protein